MKLIVKYFQSWFDFDTKPNSSEDFPTQESKALVSALVINSYGKFAGHQNPRLRTITKQLTQCGTNMCMYGTCTSTVVSMRYKMVNNN